MITAEKPCRNWIREGRHAEIVSVDLELLRLWVARLSGYDGPPVYVVERTREEAISLCRAFVFERADPPEDAQTTPLSLATAQH